MLHGPRIRVDNILVFLEGVWFTLSTETRLDHWSYRLGSSCRTRKTRICMVALFLACIVSSDRLAVGVTEEAASVSISKYI